MLGISNYAYIWRLREGTPYSLNLAQMLDDISSLGVSLAQICDAAPLEERDHREIAELRAAQRRLNMRLEVGTRGVEPAHLRSLLATAVELDARLVRTVPVLAGDIPDVPAAVHSLRGVLPAYANAGVTLGLETYEGLSVDDTVSIVEEIASPWLGIVLDPGNPIGRLELPEQTVRKCAKYTVSLHVKDVAFVRNVGSVGLILQGCDLGQGLIPYETFLDEVVNNGRNPNVIVEHWLPLHPDLRAAQVREATYVSKTVETLRTWGVSS